MTRIPILGLGLLLLVVPSVAQPPTPADFAVRLVGTHSAASAGIENGFFMRYVAPRLGKRVEVGPEARGKVTVWVDPWPLQESTVHQVRRLPVKVDHSGLMFDGTEYRHPETVLALRVPDAEHPTWIVTGTRVEGAVGLTNQLLLRLVETEQGQAEAVDYLLRENPWLGRSGNWRRRGPVYEVDPTRDRDQLAARKEALAGLGRMAGGSWVELRVPPGEAKGPHYRRLQDDLERAARRMAARIPLDAGEVELPIVVIVEPDFVTQGRHTGEIGEAVMVRGAGRSGGDLHLVYHARDRHAYLYALAQVLLEKAAWPGALPRWIRDGSALWLSVDWYGRSYQEWLPSLARAGVLPEASELLAAGESGTRRPGRRTRRPTESHPLWTPVAASVIDHLQGELLAEKLADFADGSRLDLDSAAPDKRSKRLSAAVEKAIRPRPSSPATVRAAGWPAKTPFLKGISLAMLNRLESGYHAPALSQRLERLKGLGADTVSLMPFASQPGSDQPNLRVLNSGATSETDVGLVHAARMARGRGFRVLWKPHIWVSGSGWTGEIQMTRDQDWQQWWRSYRLYVVHQAFLAAWAEADLFCVGVELGKTLDRKDDWSRLIAAVRTFFPGPLTYAANWYGDFDRVPFWDQLDVLGVDAYYSLSHGEASDLESLRGGARQIVETLSHHAKLHGKPVLLTEVGFAARRAAWKDPYQEGGAYSEEDQATAYRALLETLDGEPWLAGVFLWKVFSGPVERRQSPDFRFLDREAEEVVRQFYRRAD